MDDHETAGAGKLPFLSGGDAIGLFGDRLLHRDDEGFVLILVVVVEVVLRGDLTLEDRVEVGLNVVGPEILLVLLVIVGRRLGRLRGGLGLLVLVIDFVVDGADDGIVILVDMEVVAQVFFVEFLSS